MLLLLQKKERLFDFLALIRQIRGCISNKKTHRADTLWVVMEACGGLHRPGCLVQRIPGLQGGLTRCCGKVLPGRGIQHRP